MWVVRWTFSRGACSGALQGLGHTHTRFALCVYRPSLACTAVQGVSYGEGGLPENYPITTGMARQKFDEFDIETGKTGFLTLQAARQCLETLLLAGNIQENGELPENPGMKWDRA